MTMNSMTNPIQPPLAIVGLSALFPKAANLDQFWSNIRRGVDAITEVPETHWNPDEYFDENQKTADMTYARRGGFLSPIAFDPLEFGISPNNLEAIDTSQLLGLVGAKRALEHAGYGAGRTFDRSRVGCILGVTGTLEMVIPLGARLGHPRWRKALKDAGVADDVAQDVVDRISQSYVPWQENSFPGLLGNVVAGRIANRLDLHGTNCVVDAACASSLSAIHLAALELWTGRSNMVVTGGIDTFNDIFMFMCFSKTPALSPSGDAKPFSDAADGTILGEGVGIVVLKRLHDAERDGDRIYAILKGIGTSSDGAGNAVYAPKAEGQIRCLQDAYHVAGISPDTVELVEAHGTGTKVGDATEVSALMQVYKASGRRGSWCAVGSVKSQIGHTKAAAGAAGVIKAVLALQHRVLPPTIKVNQPPDAMLAADSPFYVNSEARPWLKPSGYPRRAAVSAFGFGGSNFHCILEESTQRFDDPEWDGNVQVIAVSAGSLGELTSVVRSKIEAKSSSDWGQLRTFASACRDAFRVEHPYRLLFVIERDKTDLAKLVAGALSMLDRYPDKAAWSTPDGAYFGRGPRTGKLGILFPGQGSQYVNMLRELVCAFPFMSDLLSEANDVHATFQSNGSHDASASRLSDFVYPRPAWSANTKTQQETELRATQVAQPAIGAVSLAVLAVLEQFGVRAEAVAGHSYGELTALCASRRFAPHVLYRLSMLRGQLMAAAQEVDGGMLAVGAPLTQVEAALKELSVDLVVANHNGPTQVVLSGRIPEIERATSLFATRNIRGKKLSVAAAFHSPLVASASRAFRPVLDEVEFLPPVMPVYANSTATEYPAEPQAARDLLATQLARPVHFVREVEQMYADGVRTFLEVGPGAVLTGLVNSILTGSDCRAVAIDGSSGKRSGLFDLATALVQLSASGYPIRWENWDPQTKQANEQNGAQRMRIPICGANYVKPRTPIPPRIASKVAQPVSQPPAPVVSVPADESRPALGAKAPEIVEAPNANFPPPPLTRVAAPTTPAPVPAQSAMTQTSPAMSEAASPAMTTHAANPIVADTIHQTIAALERIQTETSRLHQQFLQGQEAALQLFARLAAQQLAPAPSSVRHSLQPVPAPQAPPLIPAAAKEQPVRQIDRAPAPVAPPAVLSHSTITEITSPPVSPAKVPLRAPSSVSTVIPSPVPPVARPADAEICLPAVVQPTPTIETRSTTPPASTSPLASIVLAVVSEKTGYPTEMLTLEMSLDHDLGIDSIKRVEILSALQERVPNLPAFQPDELGSLHTLSDVVSLADARAGGALTATPDSRAMIEPSAINVSVHVTQSVSKAPVSTKHRSTESGASLLGPTVLAVVSEKTGYPTEMLNLEMSLDHDLGIDSIKRVEILSALQERVPNLPAFQPEELGSLQTLQDVVTLADTRSAGLLTTAATEVASGQFIEAPQPREAVAQTVARPQSGASRLGPIVLEVVSEKTGYPTEMLNLEMSLDHDLGIDSIKRVEILSALQERVSDLPAFQPEELGALHTLKDVVTLADARAGRSRPATKSVVATEDLTNTAPLIKTAPPPAAQVANQNTALGPLVLEVVSEKTGYPVEMLNLEMSLDHDLGIDSIKRVEILSALQERVPNLPAFQPDELGALQTLSDVVTLANARTSALNSTSIATSANGSAQSIVARVDQSPEPTRTATRIEIPSREIVQDASITRSIVRPVTLPPADSRTQVRLSPGAEVWVTDDGSELSLRIAEDLSNRGFKPRIVNLDDARVSNVSQNVCGLIIVSPEIGILERQLWSAIEWLQVVGPALRQRQRLSASFVATVSRLDGCFGFSANQTITDPLSGGLAGLAKCASREWPDLTVRAIDLGQGWLSPQVAASTLVSELLHDGPVEVGLTPHRAFALEVIEQSLTGLSATSPIQPGEMIVVTGGARGVTAEAACAIARAWQPHLVLLGRSPEPSSEPAWLAGLSTDAEIKRALIARAPAGTTPKGIAAECQQIIAGREIVEQLQRLRATGASVTYHSVDVRYPVSVRSIVDRLQQRFGSVRGIIHGAGVLADQRIEDKTKEQFDRVYQTKIQGLKNLMDCIDPHQLRVLGLFSSYTARFGRVGQLDYAIANEVLNKQARQFATQYPNCRVVSFNWGPWDGGMVQGGLKTLFASEGIGLIPLQAGANLLVQELGQQSSRPVEVLVLAANTQTQSIAPSLVQSHQPSGIGLTEPVQIHTKSLASNGADFANASQTDGSADFRVAFERQLDVSGNQFLESHVLGGKAVLPVAMIFEWLAHGAIHRNPGLELLGFDQFKVYQGIRLAKQDCLPLRILAGKTIREKDCFKVPMRMVSQSNGREMLHVSGSVILGATYPKPPTAELRVGTRPYPMDVASAYVQRLFHGPQFQGLIAIEGCSNQGIVVTSRSSGPTSTWMTDPARGNWLADPLAIDAALQSVILWSQEQQGKPCLPCAVGRYRQFQRTFPRDGVRIAVRVQPGADQLIRCDVEFSNLNGVLIARMEGCESVAEASLTNAFVKNQIES